MKLRIIVAAIMCIGFITTYAQSDHTNWYTDKTEACTAATTDDKQILMVFAGSDWCRPCIKLKKDILTSEGFEAYTKDKLNILYLDFPSKKKNKLSKEQTAHNEMLAEKYNTSGSFPKVILMDKAFNKIKEIDYTGQSTEEFIAELQADEK